MDYLAEVELAITRLHGCKAQYERTAPVKEVFWGQTAWEGQVEVFALTGHPKAERCYAWGYPRDGRNPEITTVLEIPPVVSPETAVRAAILAKAKRPAE